MIKNQKSQINPTTNFVNPKYKYHNLVGVKDEKTFRENKVSKCDYRTSTSY